jgi:hypothetical protein
VLRQGFRGLSQRPAGLVALAQLARSRSLDPPKRSMALVFAALVAVSLTVAWLIASTIGENDDLGLRAILRGVLIMTTFAAAGLSRGLPRGRGSPRAWHRRPCCWGSPTAPASSGDTPSALRSLHGRIRRIAAHVECRASAFGARRPDRQQSAVS